MQAGWRWVFVVVLCIAGIGGSLWARRFVPEPVFPTAPPPIPTPEPSPTSEMPSVATTPADEAQATKNVEVPPTITPTQPTPTMTSTQFIATIASEITPSPDAVITIVAISSSLSNTLEPVNADTQFPAGIPRIYVWFEYDNLANGVSWSRAVVRNGVVLRNESDAWELGVSGEDRYYFFDAQTGWPAGDYEVQFYIGDKLIDSVTFKLVAGSSN